LRLVSPTRSVFERLVFERNSRRGSPLGGARGVETMREAESDEERVAGSASVPNWLLDACLTDLSDAEVKVLLFILR
jgi:hypothetical protein